MIPGAVPYYFSGHYHAYVACKRAVAFMDEGKERDEIESVMYDLWEKLTDEERAYAERS